MGRTVKIDIYKNELKIPKDLLWQKQIYKKDDMREYRHFCRELDKLVFVKKDQDLYRNYYGIRSALSFQQNCVVELRKGKDIKAHMLLYKKYLPQENKKDIIRKPELFSDGMVDAPFLDYYFKTMTENHFKFIISPESPKVDIPALVKTLVKHMEKITGYSFTWMAAAHTDINHFYTHLLINGTDKIGADIYFDKPFITRTMSEMSRQICTEMIGKRSKDEIKASVLQSYTGNRYCSFDDTIKEQEEPLHDSHNSYGSQVQTFNDLILKRLFHLAELGLAKKNKEKEQGCQHLPPGKNLKRFQAYRPV
jgi:hypothetical protein